jgi:DNA-binding NtrC family response regulator
LICKQISQEHKTRVLLIDDETEVIQVVGEILEMTGDIEVHGASSVDEGFEMLEKEEFDVIVSDYRMPEKDGLQFLKELKEKENDKPFVMFTGKGKEQVCAEALKLGAFGFVSKNGQAEVVYAELESTIQKAVYCSRIGKQNQGETNIGKIGKHHREQRD